MAVRSRAKLKKIWILQSLRLSMTLLTGTSPLLQFKGEPTTRVGVTIQTNL